MDLDIFTDVTAAFGRVSHAQVSMRIRTGSIMRFGVLAECEAFGVQFETKCMNTKQPQHPTKSTVQLQVW